MILENTKTKLNELENIVSSFEKQRDAIAAVANDLIDGHTSSLETSIGYAARLMNLLCDYFYENNSYLYEDLDSCGDTIKKLYNELNY